MVGGTVVKVIHLESKIYINCQDEDDEYIIFVERNNQSLNIKKGDLIEWEGKFAYWTPKENLISHEEALNRGLIESRDWNIPINLIGYSVVEAPTNPMKTKVLVKENQDSPQVGDLYLGVITNDIYLLTSDNKLWNICKRSIHSEESTFGDCPEKFKKVKDVELSSMSPANHPPKMRIFIEDKDESKDFGNTETIRIVATNVEDSFKLGILFSKLVEIDAHVVHSTNSYNCCIRMPILKQAD